MSRGLIRKSVREIWVMTLLCGLGVMVFEVLLAYALRSFEYAARYVRTAGREDISVRLHKSVRHGAH